MNLGTNTPGGTWLPDGRIVFAPASTGTGLHAVNAAGGDFTVLHERGAGERDFHAPSALPEGRGVLFVVDRAEGGPDTLAVFADGKRREFLRLEHEPLDAPVYSPSGHVLYGRGSGTRGIWAVPFSLARLDRTGEPFLVARRPPGPASPRTAPCWSPRAASADGTWPGRTARARSWRASRSHGGYVATGARSCLRTAGE